MGYESQKKRNYKMRCHFTSFHLISHKNWVGRMLFFPVSFPRLAEAPIPMWRFVELYCLWGQLIQQQTFGRAKKKTPSPSQKGYEKTGKNPSDASAKKRGDYEDCFSKKVEILTENRGETKFRHGGKRVPVICQVT